MKEFNNALIGMERILNQSDYQKKYIQYRNYPEVTEKIFGKFFEFTK